MSLYQNQAGLHISKSKLQIVEVLNKNGRFILGNVDEEYFPDVLSFSDRESKIISILQNAFSELVSRKPLKSSSVSFSLPNSSFKSFDIPFDKSLAKDDLLDHLKWELSVLYPDLKSGDYLIRNIPVTTGDYREGNNIIVFVLEKNILKTLYKFCQRNNLNLKFVDHEHMSANSIIFMENDKDKESLFCSIYINDNYFSIMLLHQFKPVFFRNRQFHSPEEFMTVAKNELDNLRSLVGDLSHISASYLHGSVYSENTFEQINLLSDLNFTYSNPFSRIEKGDNLKDSELIRVKYNSFCAAAGVAFRVA